MTGRTHDLAAATALVAVITYYPLPPLTLATAVTVFAANMIGGITPDIDQPTAPLWHQIPAGSLFGHIISPLLGHHRMISHSLLGLALFAWLSKLLLTYMHTFLLVNVDLVWWSFIIGYVSHLLMDTMTKEGVPWLFPIPVRFGIPPFKLLRVTTGGLVEKFIVFPSLLIATVYLIYLHYPLFWSLITNLKK